MTSPFSFSLVTCVIIAPGKRALTASLTFGGNLLASSFSWATAHPTRTATTPHDAISFNAVFMEWLLDGGQNHQASVDHKAYVKRKTDQPPAATAMKLSVRHDSHVQTQQLTTPLAAANIES